ncbi:HPr family phosphocarrier protein [Natronospirillum operosum]|uniref:HPr family phosphocarrier protein n=1 Tax=Natronospirillum operosum TaxID=2759953 RepID=A0A4Z0WBI2_9GAMM|nr:HPr family phosphocarrier protein [Natronospirillum operosum]TGG90753.1 HPr family phosphocarrier protein [Natronospirillum operosum]
MIRESVTIINKLGLHARASAKLNAVAQQFESSIQIEKAGQRADAKSIMSIMMLAASQGTEILVEVEGPDEEAAFAAVKALIDNYFEEGE